MAVPADCILFSYDVPERYAGIVAHLETILAEVVNTHDLWLDFATVERDGDVRVVAYVSKNNDVAGMALLGVLANEAGHLWLWFNVGCTNPFETPRASADTVPRAVATTVAHTGTSK